MWKGGGEKQLDKNILGDLQEPVCFRINVIFSRNISNYKKYLLLSIKHDAVLNFDMLLEPGRVV